MVCETWASFKSVLRLTNEVRTSYWEVYTQWMLIMSIYIHKQKDPRESSGLDLRRSVTTGIDPHSDFEHRWTLPGLLQHQIQCLLLTLINAGILIHKDWKIDADCYPCPGGPIFVLT